MEPFGTGGKSSEEPILDFSKKASPEPATENTDKPTVEPAVDNKDKPAVEPAVDDKSSLKPDTSADTAPKVVDKPELNDELALKYLSEKLGKEVKDFSVFDKKEDPLEKDPYLKEIYDWRSKTGRPIEDWISYQKDFDKMPDISVAREFLKHEYPTLTESEINLEIGKFVVDEMDMDDDAGLKNLELKKYATKGRAVLNTMRSKFETPIEAPNKGVPKEVQENLDLLDKIKAQYEADQEATKKYLQSITREASSVESLPIKLSDDLTINFKLSEEERKSLPSQIDAMPHWRNEDGSWNHRAVVNDGIKIHHFDRIMQLAYAQGVNAGKEGINVDANNITLDSRNTVNSDLQNNQKGPVIDGLDEYMGNQGIKLRFGNK